MSNKGIKLGSKYLSNLRFADGIALFREISKELQNMAEELKESLHVLLKMKKQKMKVIFKKHFHTEEIFMQRKVLQRVNECAYMNKLIQTTHLLEVKNTARIRLG